MERISIRPAQKSDIKRLVELWEIVFEDDAEYIKLYFEHFFHKDLAMVLLYEGIIVSAIYITPLGNLKASSCCTLPCAYVYSFATLPAYQGRGLGKQLLRAANEEMVRRGYACYVIYPAEEGLYHYYESYGYRRYFDVRELEWTGSFCESTEPSHGITSQLRSASPKEYMTVRNSFLESHLHPYISFDERSLHYQKNVSGLYGGDIYILDYGGSMGCCCVEYSDIDEILVRELLIPEEHLKQGLWMIQREFPTKKYKIRMPAFLGNSLGGQIRSFGMILENQHSINHMEKENGTSAFQTGYFGFAFD